MARKHDISNSYLAASEFIYHAAIIGGGYGLINMIVNIYELYFLDAGLIVLLFSIIYPLAYIFVGAVIGMIIFPFYKMYAQRRGGLTISIITKEKPYSKSSSLTGAKDAPKS